MKLFQTSVNYSLRFKSRPLCSRLAAQIVRKIVFLAVFGLMPTVYVGCEHNEANTKQAQTAYDIGVTNFQNNRMREAIYHFEQALQFDPNYALAHNSLGLLYHSLKRYDDALRHYKKAIDIDPKMSEAKNNLASVYIDQGLYDKAIPLLQEALADLFYKTPFMAESNLGWALYKKGDIQEGISRTRKAVLFNPSFCMGFRNLGIMYEETNELTLAEKHFTSYAKKCPKTPDAHYRLGLVQAKLDKVDEARESFAECKLNASEASELSDECAKLEAALGPSTSKRGDL